MRTDNCLPMPQNGEDSRRALERVISVFISIRVSAIEPSVCSHLPREALASRYGILKQLECEAFSG